MVKQIKEREKRLKIPGLFFDGENWEPASKYPGFMAYTDRCLADVLGTSAMRVSMWRNAGTIPYKKMGSFAVYDVNLVIQALKAAGYSQDINKKAKL
ncbi:MAG: hypothetical protein IPJ16_13070 [Bacteroidales bacterium]|nr:hypothetical protein [Bacteroidales bacterium]